MEEHPWRPKFESAAGFDRHRHQRAIGRRVVQLLPVCPPTWLVAAVSRNLMPFAGRREWLGEDIRLTAEAARVGHPPAIWRERGRGFGELRLDDRKWFSIAEERQRPYVRIAHARALCIGDIPAIGR